MSRALKIALAVVCLIVAAPTQALAHGGGHWAAWARRGWIPRDLGPLAAFRGETYNASTGVWRDTSGNGNNATLVSVKPTAGSINSKASVTFPGSSGQTLRTPSVSAGAFTVLLVAKIASGTYPVVQITDASTNGSYMYTNTAPSLNIARGSVVSSKNRATNWFADNAIKSVSWRFDGTHAGHLLDVAGQAQTLTTVTGNDPGAGAISGQWGIGGRPDGGGPVAGDIGEVLILARSISSVELARWFFYTTSFWGN